MISVNDLSEYFVEVADTLVDDFDVVEFLDNLARRAAEVSGAGAVGLVLSDHRGRVRFMAASNESGKMLELLQIQNDEGPCLEALVTGVPVVNADLAHAEDRWPVFAPRAIEAGFRSVHAFPMRLRSNIIGALNLFGTEDSRFEEEEIRVVQALADVATIAILQERTLAQAETLTEQLQGALNSRIVIEQAKGALAQANGISTAEAFDLLRGRARTSRMRLVDVAQEVLEGLEGLEHRGHSGASDTE
jgi:GAF domain-containing protein